jgi:hypothetical protein
MIFILNILDSLKTKDNRFSARKLSAFAAVWIGIYSTILKVNEVNLEYVLYAWLAFALLCLGIVTIEQIIKLKNGKDELTNSGTDNH